VRRETGKEQLVRVRCSERVATYAGPESCATDCEVGGEALTGELPGWVLSHEMTFRMPTLFRERKAIRGLASSRAELRSGVVGDPSMAGRSLFGNREVSRLTGGGAAGPHREGASRSR
jgi:hypothetical protein